MNQDFLYSIKQLFGLEYCRYEFFAYDFRFRINR